MCFDGRPEGNLGEVIENLFCPRADISGSAGSKWRGFRMKPRGVSLLVKRRAYDVLSWTSDRYVGNEPA